MRDQAKGLAEHLNRDWSMISRLHAAHEETGYQLGIEAAALAEH
jgi:hypothetical protein